MPACETQSYFASHSCLLADHKQNCKDEIKCGRFRSFILDLVTANTNDIRAKYMYRSYAAFRAEKYRQFSEYPLTIHPFSKLRLWIELVVSASILISTTLKPIQFTSVKADNKGNTVDVILFACNFVFIINCIANILTGYADGENKQRVVLDIKRIILKYAVTWMILDVLAIFSLIFYNVFNHFSTEHIAMVTTGILKYPFLFKYAGNMCKVARLGVPAKTAVELTLYLISYLTCNVVLQFSIEYLLEGSPSPGNPRPISWMTRSNLWNATSTVRFFYSLERAVGMLRQNANLSSFRLLNGSYEIFPIIAWFISKVIVLHCTFKFMLALFSMESARAKYYLMSQQVQTYIKQRRLPARIKEKILKFYAIRYQSHFFVESHMIESLSGQLREDMIMFTGNQLLQEMDFFKEMPRALLLQITLKFKLVIFIEGDIIFKINTVGNNLFFISKGTVAMYSQSGCEICHVEDGEYFGEIALVMKSRLRSSSAVAVTNCELFSLSREDFESVACYPTVYEKIKKAALRRKEQMSVLEEQFKAQMRILDENF